MTLTMKDYLQDWRRTHQMDSFAVDEITLIVYVAQRSWPDRPELQAIFIGACFKRLDLPSWINEVFSALRHADDCVFAASVGSPATEWFLKVEAARSVGVANDLVISRSRDLIGLSPIAHGVLVELVSATNTRVGHSRTPAQVTIGECGDGAATAAKNGSSNRGDKDA